jgi:hypothetical protein
VRAEARRNSRTQTLSAEKSSEARQSRKGPRPAVSLPMSAAREVKSR